MASFSSRNNIHVLENSLIRKMQTIFKQNISITDTIDLNSFKKNRRTRIADYFHL